MKAESDIVQLLDELIHTAALAGASDIHVEPQRDRLRVRLRVDGVMAAQPSLSPNLGAPMISRAKVLGRMDIAEKRLPQDGTFSLEIAGRRISLRASTFPCAYGEKLVLRLLQGMESLPLEKIGMGSRQIESVRRLAKQNGGLVLVTGPTGSGKTSTLYAMLREVDTQSLNVVTLEDPIEVQLQEITQGQVHNKAGFTFARGLRAILRQDPDVILVGEMRDLETTSIAFQASLTGHLVLSTLHTNSALETITRLIDIGLEPYIVAHAIVGIISQRLVRKLCSSCAVSYDDLSTLLPEVGFPIPQAPYLQPQGCKRCLKTGYRGRMGLYEIIEIDDRLRNLIKLKAGASEFKSLLREMGIPTLRRVGMHHAITGITSPDEVLRVT